MRNVWLHRLSLFVFKVSWVKRERDNDSLQLLTVGKQTYSGDSRFSVEFQYPNNWRLRIADANKSDEGLYECQISTYPPRVIKTFFRVHCKYLSIDFPLLLPLIDESARTWGKSHYWIFLVRSHKIFPYFIRTSSPLSFSLCLLSCVSVWCNRKLMLG